MATMGKEEERGHPPHLKAHGTRMWQRKQAQAMRAAGEAMLTGQS